MLFTMPTTLNMNTTPVLEQLVQEPEPAPTTPMLNDWTNPAEQEPQGSPAMPVEEKAETTPLIVEEQKRDEYWRNLLTGSPDTIPDEIRIKALPSGENAPSVPEEESNYELLGNINRSWMVDYSPYSREEVQNNWPGMRAELAREMGVESDEHEVFVALSEKARTDEIRRVAQKLYEDSYKAALLGDAMPMLPEEEDEEMAAAWSAVAEQAQNKALEEREEYLPLAMRVFVAWEVLRAAEVEMNSLPYVVRYSPEFFSALEELSDMPEEKRNRVYNLAQVLAKEAGVETKPVGTAEAMGRSLLRGADALRHNLIQGVGYTAAAAVDSFGATWNLKSVRHAASKVDSWLRMLRELREVAQGRVYPITLEEEEAGLASQLAVDAASGTPMALLPFCGRAGFGIMASAAVGDIAAEARKRMPEGEMTLQVLSAMAGASIQSAIYSCMGDVGRKVVGNTISSFMKAKGQGLKGYSLAALQSGARFLEANAKMLAAGKASQGISLGSQEFAAWSEGLDSHIDWRLYGNNLLDIETNMREAAMNLPYILIASGRAALHHFRSPNALVSDSAALESWGVNASVRKRISEEPNIQRQNEMLRQALSGSKRWSGMGFFPEIMRAMNLLNTKDFQGFKEEAVVREFLQLPAQLPNRLNEMKMRELLTPELQQEALARLAPAKLGKSLSSRALESLQMMDLWYRKADVWKQQIKTPHAARYRFLSEINRQGKLVPKRLKFDGFYRPHVEKERQQFLANKMDELNSLSYNFLLLTHSMDGLAHSFKNRDLAEKYTEHMRKRLLSHVFRAIMQEECGIPAEEAFRPFNDYIYQVIRERKKSFNAPAWLSQNRKVGSQWFKLAHTMPMERLEEKHFSNQHRYVTWLKQKSWKHYVDKKPYIVMEAPNRGIEQGETLECFRIITGMHAKAEYIREILPYMEDYQTALTRGMSPLQAMSHIIEREFGEYLIPEIWKPESLAENPTATADMENFTARNKDLYQQYHAFTGRSLESTQLEGGKKLWRIQRPDGKYTRWHSAPEEAINDMVANSLNSFRSLWLADKKMRAQENLKPLGLEGKPEEESLVEYTTAHDLLGGTAARELTRFWLEDATRTPVGLDYTLVPKGYNWKYLSSGRGERKGEDVKAFWYSARATPYTMMRNHFAGFWKMALQENRVDAEKLMDFLHKRGVIRPQGMQSLELLAHGRKRYLKNFAGPVRRWFLREGISPDIQPDIPLLRHRLSQYMADYSMRYFLSNLNSLPMPNSVREWFSLIPLCPEDAPADRGYRKANRFITLGTRANGYSVKRLQRQMGLVSEYKEKYMAEDEQSFIGELLKESVGNSSTQRLEQGWCFALSGSGSMRARDHAIWDVLRDPAKNWNSLLPETQQELRTSLEADLSRFCAPGEAMSPSLEKALSNLQSVLVEHPELRNYMLEPGPVEKLFRMQLNEPELQGLFPAPKTRSELFYDSPVRLMRNGFELFPEEALPETMEGDARVKPALRFLSHMRHQFTSVPYADEFGIWWQGKRYGGTQGERPPGLGPEWTPQPLLLNFRNYLERLNQEARSENTEGVLEVCGVKLRGLTSEMLDSSLLEKGTLYTNRKMPKYLLRLMPGEAYAANPYLRAPYVVHSSNGALLLPRTILRKLEERHLAFQPLRSFDSLLKRDYLDKSTLRIGREHILDLLDEVVFRRASSRANLDASKNAELSNVEIIMQLAQDSRLSDYIAQINPREMTRGEALTVSLLRNMVEYEFGRDKRRAAKELVELCRKLRRSENDMSLLRRTLLRLRSYQPPAEEDSAPPSRPSTEE